MEQGYGKLIVERIRFLCDRRGISINRLATMSGVSQATLNNIVNVRSENPKIKTLHKIALAFSMTLPEFLDFPELENYSFEEEEDN